MLDVIVQIATLLKDGLPLFQGQTEKNRKRTFGKAAVTCYLRLLEVIAAAESIRLQVEFFHRRFKEHLDRADDWEYDRRDLQNALKKQSINLMRLGWALKAIRVEMEILAPHIARRITMLVERKRNVVARLAEYCASGRLPLRITIGDSAKPWCAPEVTAELVDTRPIWELDTHQRLDQYLEDAAPADRIRALQETAATMRELLVKTFTLDELLWSTEQFNDETDFLF
jgi:hypothetical protein